MEPTNNDAKHNALGDDPFAHFDDLSWIEDVNEAEQPIVTPKADAAQAEEAEEDESMDAFARLEAQVRAESGNGKLDGDESATDLPVNLPTAVFPDTHAPQYDEDDPFALLDAEMMAAAEEAMVTIDEESQAETAPEEIADEEDDPFALLDAAMMADAPIDDAIAVETAPEEIADEEDDPFALLDAAMMADAPVDDAIAAETAPEEIADEEDDLFSLLDTAMLVDTSVDDTVADDAAESVPNVAELLAAIDSQIEDINDVIHYQTEEEGVAEVEMMAEETAVIEETAVSDTYLDDLISSIDGEIDALHKIGTTDDGLETAVSTTTEQHIIFSLANVEYTVSIDNVIEIGRPLNITSMPNVPNWTLGVANLRGDIISIVDLRMFLGMPVEEYGENGRLLVSQSQVEDITIGLLVDRVSGIGNLQPQQISAPTAPIQDEVAPYLRGVYEYEGRMLVVLNLDKLLLSSEMQQFETV